MTQADFTYASATDGAGLAASVAIFANGAVQRQQMAQDMEAAGFRVSQSAELAQLLSGDVTLLGDVVLIECLEIDAQTMAALARLDMRVARSGAQLIVLTSMRALDGVFAAFDQTAPQILVDSTRADQVVAVGRIAGHADNRRVRDLSEQDRLALLRLSEQVDAIAQRLDGLEAAPAHSASVFRLSDKGEEYHVEKSGNASSRRVALPDPRVVRRMIQQRQARAKFFDAELFADPAWDMLLDLTAAKGEKAQVSVTSLCIASGVPATTALRWIRQMSDAGLFERVEDEADRRRAFIALSDRASDAMARYFAEIQLPVAAAA